MAPTKSDNVDAATLTPVYVAEVRLFYGCCRTCQRQRPAPARYRSFLRHHCHDDTVRRLQRSYDTAAPRPTLIAVIAYLLRLRASPAQDAFAAAAIYL